MRAQEAGYPLVVSLMFDGMHIMKSTEKDEKGFVNFGKSVPVNDNKTPIVATEALVFMVSCINQSWKIPIAYFLHNGLTAVKIAGLVNQCLVALNECKVNVVSLTFDGTRSNISAAKKLKEINRINTDNVDLENNDKLDENDTCDLNEIGNLDETGDLNDSGDLNEYDWWFNHPITQEEIVIILDPCHMLKLIRNVFVKLKTFRDGNGKLIQWKFFEFLHQIQSTESMHLGNKLRAAHINYVKQKMKVRLAAQLFSKSVADSLRVCKDDLKLPGFLDCGPTINFIETVNDLFDIFNSRNMRGYDFHRGSNSFNYKKALNSANKDSIFNKLNEISTYIQNLKSTNDKLLVKSLNKTGFVGFLVCIESLKKLYTKLCEGKNCLLKYIPTYKLSQDHLETFFSAIRSRGGHNSNPTGRQFSNAFKKLLLHTDLQSIESGNCIPIEQISILHVSSRNVSSLNVINRSTEIFRLCETVDHSWSTESECVIIDGCIPDISIITEFSKRVIAYVAGFVVKHLRSKLCCEECLEVLIGSYSCVEYSLIAYKNQGGLCYPSNDVFLICQKAEKAIRFALRESGGKILKPKFSDIYLTSMVLKEFLCSEVIFQSLVEHNHNQDALENHRVHLIRCIIQKYIKTRLFYIAKTAIGDDIKTRQFYTNLVQFTGH